MTKALLTIGLIAIPVALVFYAVTAVANMLAQAVAVLP